MSKQEIIAGLRTGRRNLVAFAETVPAEKRDERFLGVWSMIDIMAHLVGWDYTNIDAVSDIRSGKLPRVFESYDEDWASFNGQLVARHRKTEWAEMVRALEDSQQALIAHLEAVPEEDFDRDFGVRSLQGHKLTIAGYLQPSIEDEQTHLRQLSRQFTR